MLGDHVSMFCLRCGYDLRGLSANACPECGRAFDPTDPATYALPAKINQTLKYVAIGLVAFALVLDGIAFLAGESDGGRGWAFAFPITFFGGMGALLLSFVACCLAMVYLIQAKGKSPAAWLVLTLALLAGGSGYQFAGWAVEAVAAV